MHSTCVTARNYFNNCLKVAIYRLSLSFVRNLYKGQESITSVKRDMLNTVYTANTAVNLRTPFNKNNAAN